jgi:hypothetical protein
MSDFDDAMRVPDSCKNKNYRYCWVTDEPKMQTIAKMRGYEAILASGPDGAGFKGDPRVAADGRIRVGDAVLMRCPEPLVREREERRKRKNRGIINEIKEEYHAQVTGLGIRSFEETTK